MKKGNQIDTIGITLGIVLGIILNAYLIWDVLYYGLQNKHSPLDFIWRLYLYLGESSPLNLALVFVVVQVALTTVYCVLFSSYFVSNRRIIPPSFVLLGASVPLLFIAFSLSLQFFQETHAIDPLNASYVLSFFTTFLYVIFLLGVGTYLDRIVRNIIGASYDEKQMEESVQPHSSSLGFGSLVELIEDRKWLKDYASLSVVESHKDEEKNEGFFRLKKVGTDYCLCISISQVEKQSFVLLTSYELREARFGKELIVNEEVTGALASQMEFIQERLKLSKATTEVGFVKKAVHCTVRISKGPFEKMIPYKLQVLIVFLNIIALVALSYFNSIHTIDSSVAIAIYTLILMISLEVFRLRTKGR